MDAIAAAQVLSEIGYLLRQNPKEVYRARAFSAAAWTLALERPNLDALFKDNKLTSIEGVGEGIAKVLAGLIETGQSTYLERLRAETASRRATTSRASISAPTRATCTRIRIGATAAPRCSRWPGARTRSATSTSVS